MTLLQAYLQSPKARRALSKRPGDKGFSLIELVVVVAILAILAAVALPNFLGVSKDGQIAAAKNTLATAIKECSVKETRSNVATIGTTGEAGKDAPIRALAASLNGYNLVKLPAGGIAAVTSGDAKIDLSGADNGESCYAIAAVSPTETLPTFSVSFNSTSGGTEKKCAIPDNDSVYREGCYTDSGDGSPTNTAAEQGSTDGVW